MPDDGADAAAHTSAERRRRREGPHRDTHRGRGDEPDPMLLPEMEGEIEVVVHLGVAAVHRCAHAPPRGSTHREVGSEEGEVSEGRGEDGGVGAQVGDRQGRPKESRAVDESSSAREDVDLGSGAGLRAHDLHPGRRRYAVRVEAEDEVALRGVVPGCRCRGYPGLDARDDARPVFTRNVGRSV